jgi:hypothetical protein
MLDDLIDVTPAGASSAASSPKAAIKGIAIVGSHPATAMEAPFADPAWEIWACSPDNTPFGSSKEARELPRVDDWFEVHAPLEHHSRPYGYLQYVAKLPKVWMRDQRALASGLFPGARPYPEQQMYGTDALMRGTQKVAEGVYQDVAIPMPVGDGLFCPWMFTSSIAYMLAKAIVDCEARSIGAIGLWGILQSSDNEYAYQRPGTQYFLWEARRRGIEVLVAPESRLAERPAANW